MTPSPHPHRQRGRHPTAPGDGADTPSRDGALELPPPFSSASVGAHVEYSHRTIEWTLTDPGDLYRNRYDVAWVEIFERDPWRGEPLWLTASRRLQGDSWSRQPFTDTARDRLHQLLVPAVARYGFDRLWCETRASMAFPARDRASAAAARRQVAWWDTKADLAEMHRDGLLELRPIPAGQHRPAQLVVATNTAGVCREEVVAEALRDGDHVGWMTNRGDLIPDGAILQERKS